MTTPKRLDLTDPMVREMADRNHTPVERWKWGNGPSTLLTVFCEACGEKWPCETRRALRALPPDTADYGVDLSAAMYFNEPDEATP